MGARLFDQRDVGAAGPTERITEAGDELDPTGTAADHDHAMEVVARRGLGHRLIRRRIRHG
jgi:hypothetical protein